MEVTTAFSKWEMALEALAGRYFEYEAMIDDLTSKINKADKKLLQEHAANREVYARSTEDKRRTVEKKFEILVSKVNSTISHYEAQMQLTTKQLFEGSDDSSVYNIDENKDYLDKKELLEKEFSNKKVVLEKELENQLEKLKSQYDSKHEKLRIQYASKASSKEEKDYNKKEKKREKQEKYLEYLKVELKNANDKLDLIHKQNTDEMKEFLEAPKSKAEVKLEEELKDLKEKYAKTKILYDESKKQLDNAKIEQRERMRREAEMAIARKEQERRDKQQAELDTMLADIEQQRRALKEAGFDYDEIQRKESIAIRGPRQMLDMPVIDIAMTKKDEQEFKKRQEIKDKTNGLLKQMKAKYPNAFSVVGFRNLQDKVLFTVEDSRGKILHYKWYDSEKEFNRQYDFLDVMEYDEDYETEIFEKCPEGVSV